MRQAESVLFADLGPNVAVVTAVTSSGPAAVINQRCNDEDEMRDQAACRLLAAGFDATTIFGVLGHGVYR